MDSSKLSFKFFLADGSHFETRAIVPVLHRWIQTHAVADHLLIDVADYAHVKSGPGTVLVAHEGNFSTDLAIGGGAGLLYVRKTALAGDLAARIKEAMKITLTAAAALEKEPTLAGQIHFRADSAVFRIYDRLEAPSSPATFEAIRPALETVLGQAWGSPVKLEFKQDAEGVFEVKIAGQAADVSSLLARVQ